MDYQYSQSNADDSLRINKLSFHIFKYYPNEAACREKLVSCRWFWIGQVTKAALTRRILGGTTQTFIWLPYPVREKKLCQALEYENSKKMDIFFFGGATTTTWSLVVVV